MKAPENKEARAPFFFLNASLAIDPPRSKERGKTLSLLLIASLLPSHLLLTGSLGGCGSGPAGHGAGHGDQEREKRRRRRKREETGVERVKTRGRSEVNLLFKTFSLSPVSLSLSLSFFFFGDKFFLCTKTE
jgi:hypothetical protein